MRNNVPKFAEKVDDQGVVEEPVEIVPTITKVSAAGEMRIDFTPP